MLFLQCCSSSIVLLVFVHCSIPLNIEVQNRSNPIHFPRMPRICCVRHHLALMPHPHDMTHHAQQDSDIAMLNDVQERLARLQVAHGIEYMNTASYIQHMPRQPVHAAANPLLGSIHLVLRLKSQPPPQPQDKIRVQNIDETDSATDPDDQSQASTDDDTLSDFGSDSDNDAVWDCALDDAESVQEEPSDEKEEPVDYLAIMEADIAINAAALEGRENIGWEARWNIAEEVMLGEIAIYEMDRYDPDEEIYPWEFE